MTVIQKFTVEIEAEELSQVDLFGSDMIFTLCGSVVTVLKETGYKVARVKHHNGRNSRSFEIVPGELSDSHTIQEV